MPPRRPPTERSWADCPTNIIVARDLSRNLAVRSEFTEAPSNLDLTLLPGITFTGRAKDKERAPVTNATVEVGMVESQTQLSDVKSDNEGRFVLAPVCEGPVTVHAQHGHGTEPIPAGSSEKPGSSWREGRTSCQGGDTNVVVRLGPAAP